MSSLFDPGAAEAAVLEITRQQYETYNTQNTEAYLRNVAGWTQACKDKGVILPGKPVPALRYHVSDTGAVSQGPDFVCPPAPDPVLTATPSTGSIAANVPFLTNEQHFQLIEAMLREIYKKLPA